MISGIYGPGIRSEWQELTPENARAAEAAIGVFEIRDSDGSVSLGYASATSPFGLRGELLELATADPQSDRSFRAEVITTYLTRFYELAGRQLADGADRVALIGRDAKAGAYQIASVMPVGRQTTDDPTEDTAP